MTGFGRASRQVGGKKFSVEITSLNSKNFDLIMRSQQLNKSAEIDLRNQLSDLLHRGKTDVSINIEMDEELMAHSINKGAVKNYCQELKTLAIELNLPETDWLAMALKMPNATLPESDELTEEEYAQLMGTAVEAGKSLTEFRKSEGEQLQKDVTLRVQQISENLERIIAIDPERIANIKSRIANNLESLIGKENIDQNRYEQEVIYYLEKIDITEEKVRLESHCKFFMEILGQDKIVKGRKLNFISQEMGREINTIGSKANNADIQKLVVQMKDDLEKIKEQLLNVL